MLLCEKCSQHCLALKVDTPFSVSNLWAVVPWQDEALAASCPHTDESESGSGESGSAAHAGLNKTHLTAVLFTSRSSKLPCSLPDLLIISNIQSSAPEHHELSLTQGSSCIVLLLLTVVLLGVHTGQLLVISEPATAFNGCRSLQTNAET